MLKRGILAKETALLLRGIGVEETTSSINSKISGEAFSFYAYQVASAMKYKIFDIVSSFK